MSDQSAEALALTTAAEQVRQQLRLPGYGGEAIAHLSHTIDAQRTGLALAERVDFITAVGCYLGECLVRTYQGEWAAGPDGTTGVGIAGQLFFNPFFLVKEQLDKGTTASVASFFASVPWRLADRQAAHKDNIS
ncbi:hypothetical protein [Hymenobacter sp. BT559]|uniref:hypothetical protein n=1 Tax=Hymenobacter sp. BT559 TaxID=2795729 RepID=UPI0018ED4218|nr:hypothetical protein [Hymenobacter sp. BT559]MBJ6143591.1 hypothetical protein [Hymenobacter sp. BT559]